MNKFLAIAATATTLFAGTAAMASGPEGLQFRDTLVEPAYMEPQSPLSFGAYSEYAVEAETYTLGFDTRYEYNDFTFGVAAVFTGPSSAFAFDSTTWSVGYNLTPTTAVYTSIELNDSFSYREATIGVVARF